MNDDLLTRFKSAGAPDEILTLDSEFHFEIKGLPVAFGPYTDPLLDAEYAYIAFIPPEAFDDDNAFKGICNQVLERCPDATAVLIRTQNGRPHSSDHSRIHSRFLERRTSAGWPQDCSLPDGMRTARLTNETQGPYAKMLVAAAERGAAAQGVTVNGDAVRESVESDVLGTCSGDSQALIVLAGNVVVGHITWVDTGDQVELIDIDSVDPTDLRRLIDPLICEVFKLTNTSTFRGSVVGNDENAERAFSNLTTAGWTLTETYWIIDGS